MMQKICVPWCMWNKLRTHHLYQYQDSSAYGWQVLGKTYSAESYEFHVWIKFQQDIEKQSIKQEMKVSFLFVWSWKILPAKQLTNKSVLNYIATLDDGIVKSINVTNWIHTCIHAHQSASKSPFSRQKWGKFLK